MAGSLSRPEGGFFTWDWEVLDEPLRPLSMMAEANEADFFRASLFVLLLLLLDAAAVVVDDAGSRMSASWLPLPFPVETAADTEPGPDPDPDPDPTG
jgi:hypothetical protein